MVPHDRAAHDDQAVEPAWRIDGNVAGEGRFYLKATGIPSDDRGEMMGHSVSSARKRELYGHAMPLARKQELALSIALAVPEHLA